MIWPELTRARILVVDDDESETILLGRALAKGGCVDIHVACTPAEAIEKYYSSHPDLVILDFHLPGASGIEVMETLFGAEPNRRHAPVLMLTGTTSEEIKRNALMAGVADFVSKDADMTEVLLRARNILQLRGLVSQIERQREWLEETVKTRTRELRGARREVLERLAIAAEYRDDDTGEHTRRVGHLSSLIAKELGESERFVESIAAAALLHDLGKIGVPDGILLKPSKLSEHEFNRMKEHTEIGARILDGCTEPLLQMAQEIALSHHERWDGSGYPRGLAGTAIPLCGRIVAVADVFDAMTHERPYKAAIPAEESIEFIQQNSGILFDSRVVDAFVSAVAKSIELPKPSLV